MHQNKSALSAQEPQSTVEPPPPHRHHPNAQKGCLVYVRGVKKENKEKDKNKDRILAKFACASDPKF